MQSIIDFFFFVSLGIVPSILFASKKFTQNLYNLESFPVIQVYSFFFVNIGRKKAITFKFKFGISNHAQLFVTNYL